MKCIAINQNGEKNTTARVKLSVFPWMYLKIHQSKHDKMLKTTPEPHHYITVF